MRKYDQKQLADFDDDALAARVKQAQAKVREALLADPIMQALVDLYAAEVTRSHRHAEAVGHAARLGDPRQLSPAPIAGDPSWAELLRTVTAEGARLAADEQDARDQARTEAGDKAARA